MQKRLCAYYMDMYLNRKTLFIKWSILYYKFKYYKVLWSQVIEYLWLTDTDRPTISLIDNADVYIPHCFLVVLFGLMVGFNLKKIN